ncbi:hypothetical protein E8F11_10460 [Pseudomonas sp. BN417]|uniref:hypothetical protein n=1 Tax=Pseudomonas sp. BN417 TaxID=2567890 RepID=UPI0024571DEA|nr:hypothetical protein [Pseudomonas sp. BN417]MDH4555594.1 hypothetical protein [Pseudomonas sp. BN417]
MKQKLRQRSAVAIRQELYRQRKEAEGYRRKTLWLHQDSEQQGFKCGQAGGAMLPVPEGLDQLSYCAGWFRGAGEREMPVFCSSCREQLGTGAARDYYDLLTGQPYELICDECEALIAGEKNERL